MARRHQPPFEQEYDKESELINDLAGSLIELFPMTEMRQKDGLPAGVVPIPRRPGPLPKK
ncbi:hypothetical protein SBC1_67800 (plasmid) [Caballeronia sp. SBC1]|nr:hypothetical protein SBC2_67540 [Caballeronia sp. SBC2]QIN66733.1 hypothetical protein SBC1_67800 [Caballeronia sp. SBC1]